MIDHDRLFKELLTTFFVEFIELFFPDYPIALFSYTAPIREEPSQHRVAFPNRVVLEFNYEVVQLNRLNWRDFVRQRNPVASALMARMGIAAEDRPRVKLECLNLLVRLRLEERRQRLIARFIDTYLRLSPAEEQRFRTELEATTPMEKEAVMEIMTSWEERGLQQGREEGRQQEAATLVIRLLTRRFGSLTAELQEQIKTLSTAQLEELGESLLDFTAQTELIAWLQRNK